MKKIKGRSPTSANTKRASKQKGSKAVPVPKGWTYRKTWDGCDGYGWMIYIDGERFAWAGSESSAKVICDKANDLVNSLVPRGRKPRASKTVPAGGNV